MRQITLCVQKKSAQTDLKDKLKKDVPFILAMLSTFVLYFKDSLLNELTRDAPCSDRVNDLMVSR